ncbi:MAG: 3-dehydroquinate synthase [Pseudomonadota bacterium]
MTNQRVHVALGNRSYDVIIGSGVASAAGADIKSLQSMPSAVAIVSDETVAGHHLQTLLDSLDRADVRVRATINVPAGESSKSLEMFGRVARDLLACGLERKDAVVALGGGVVGDLAGYAAASVRRGVPFIQIPTSLLAQVDSSVGGKTGINTPEGKNLLGAFHQPSLVLCDIDMLRTLPDRQFAAGYAEVAKYGLLGDRDFFDWLEANRDALLQRDEAALVRAVRRSVEMKAGIVVRDETEQGDRALLNLGHTFGHALEAWAGFSDRLLHGEAVAIGMVLAFRFSEMYGDKRAPPQSAAQVAAHLKAFGLPTRIGDIPHDPGTRMGPDRETLVALMRQDKKVIGGRITLILAHAIGAARVVRDVDEASIAGFLDDMLTE